MGELHTLQLTPQQWVRVRRLARQKLEHDINHRRWSLFFKDVNPRKPAPSPDYGIISKCPSIFGNRLFWGQLKSAFHGGSRRFRSWHWKGHEEVEIDGHICHSIPGYGYGTTATSIVPGFRPPSRYKAKHMDRMRLICDASSFIQAIQHAISQGLI